MYLLPSFRSTPSLNCVERTAGLKSLETGSSSHASSRRIRGEGCSMHRSPTIVPYSRSLLGSLLCRTASVPGVECSRPHSACEYHCIMAHHLGRIPLRLEQATAFKVSSKFLTATIRLYKDSGIWFLVPSSEHDDLRQTTSRLTGIYPRNDLPTAPLPLPPRVYIFLAPMSSTVEITIALPCFRSSGSALERSTRVSIAEISVRAAVESSQRAPTCRLRRFRCKFTRTNHGR